jgi:uncharacterized membrane protein YphA (DoxX/SURF4 family)
MKPYLMLLLRVLLGSVFFISGTAKLLNLNDFAGSLEALGILHSEFVAPLSLIIPLFETILGSMLIGGIFTHYVSRAILALLVVFSIVILMQLVKGNITDCNCFGTLFPSHTDSSALIRNSLFAIISIFLMNDDAILLSFDTFLIKTLKEGRGLRHILAQNWLEFIAAFAILLLFILCIGLVVPSIFKAMGLPWQTDQQSRLSDGVARSQFASLNQIKQRLMSLEPAADSISAFVLSGNVELFELYSGDESIGRYLSVIENPDCKSCDDLHFAVKLSPSNRILNFVFFTPIEKDVRVELVEQLGHRDLQDAFDVGYFSNGISVDAVWRYYFFKGLKDANQALQTIEAFTETNIEGRH